jgi:hypothetical protein
MIPAKPDAGLFEIQAQKIWQTALQASQKGDF